MQESCNLQCQWFDAIINIMKIAVIGTGTAGILSISFLLTYLKKSDSGKFFNFDGKSLPL